MNIVTIGVVVSSLAVGLLAGFMLTDDEAPQSNDVQNIQDVVTYQADVVQIEPVDFVSTRPEVSALPMEELSSVEQESITFMREEEKLARDVYSTLYDQWGLQIFTNIAQSEQTHTEAVRDLLVKYGIDDPVVDDTVGVFTNETLQELYDDLVEQGLVSEVEALKVGALVEELDIFDLQRFQSDIDNVDITLVYENLERASRNHLRAFASQLEKRGVSHDAVYLTQEVFDTIKDSEKEKGGGGSAEGEGASKQKGKGGQQGGGRGWGRQEG